MDTVFSTIRKAPDHLGVSMRTLTIEGLDQVSIGRLDQSLTAGSRYAKDGVWICVAPNFHFPLHRTEVKPVEEVTSYRVKRQHSTLLLTPQVPTAGIWHELVLVPIVINFGAVNLLLRPGVAAMYQEDLVMNDCHETLEQNDGALLIMTRGSHVEIKTKECRFSKALRTFFVSYDGDLRVVGH